MAITTVDGALAGMKPPERYQKTGIATMAIGPGRYHSTFYEAGHPGAAAAPAPGVNGAALTAYAGQVPIPAASGNTHLARFSASASVACNVLLCDRLWHNSGLSVTLTTLQGITPVAIPARDKNGAALGHGVMAGLEVSTIMGAGVPVYTLTYTDQDGNTGITAALPATVAAAPVGTFQIWPLAAGDTGVRAVTGFQASATSTSGAFHIVLFRVVASIACRIANVEEAVDMLTSGFPRLYDTSVPFIIRQPSATTLTNTSGQVIYAQG